MQVSTTGSNAAHKAAYHSSEKPTQNVKIGKINYINQCRLINSIYVFMLQDAVETNALATNASAVVKDVEVPGFPRVS